MKQIPSRFNFRAWDASTKSMHPCGVSPNQMSPGKPYIVFHDIRDGYYLYQRKNCVLMQSTGLCDQAGKEIYEGDICQATCNGFPHLGVVTWERAKLKLAFLDSNGSDEVACITHVLGNRYKDPKLITAAN